MAGGVYRIRVTDFSVCEVGNNSCKKCELRFPEAVDVARLFEKHGNLGLITDESDSRFLKGGFSDGRIVGSRIGILPDGRVLNKMYSLFAPDLRIHDERSNIHWDVICRNPNGSYAYIYTVEKEESARKAKYEKVVKFEECLPRLKRNLSKALSDDALALPMLILLKTKMRVGNEIYYLRNYHKGLTTLKKQDIKIKGDRVSFDFVGKDGVPQKITDKFSSRVVDKLRKVMRSRKADEFVFVNSGGHPFKDTAFEVAFEKYCGIKFYPHIVRSHYATRETENFLEKNRGADKDEIRRFCLKLADKLGHKKFSKKNGDWEDCYRVTLHHYVRPELVEKLGL